MLIKVFTVWLVASNITVLAPIDNGCRLWFVGKDHITIRDKSCDEVAIEINERVKSD